MSSHVRRTLTLINLVFIFFAIGMATATAIMRSFLYVNGSSPSIDTAMSWLGFGSFGLAVLGLMFALLLWWSAETANQHQAEQSERMF